MRRQRVRLVFPARQALLFILPLPASDPAEIAGMVELQIDKRSPFPPDQLVIGREILARSENGCRVLAVAARREEIAAAARPLQEAGRVVERIDLDILDTWRALVRAGAVGAEGREWHLAVEEGRASLLVFDAGQPVLFRALRPAPAPPDDAWRREMAEDLAQSDFSLQLEAGAAAANRLIVWSAADPPDPALAALPAPAGWTVEARTLPRAPSPDESSARGSTPPDADALNLAPPEWAAARAARALRRRFVLACAASLAAAALISLALAAATQLRAASVRRLERRVAALETSARAATELQDRLVSLRRYADRSQSVLEVLREIVERMPGGVELRWFEFGKDRHIVMLRGQASAAGRDVEFIAALEKSPLFGGVEPDLRGGEFAIRLTLAGGAP